MLDIFDAGLWIFNIYDTRFSSEKIIIRAGNNLNEQKTVGAILPIFKGLHIFGNFNGISKKWKFELLENIQITFHTSFKMGTLSRVFIV